MPTLYKDQAIVPPPAYHQAQGRQRPALHSDVLSERQHVARVHAVPFGCSSGSSSFPPPLPAGSGGIPHTYSDEILFLIALLLPYVGSPDLGGYARLVVQAFWWTPLSGSPSLYVNLARQE